MCKRWLLCVLLGTLAWGQAPGTPPPAPSNQAPSNRVPSSQVPMASAANQTQPPVDQSASVAADAAVLTIRGVCPPQPKAPAAKAAAAKPAAAKATDDCKTVITKAQFERLASGVAPNMTPQLRKQLASVLPRLMAMSQAAEKKGLDKSPRYTETVKFAKMQILANELQRNIQEEAAKVPEEEIAAYYAKNSEAYEQYNLDRVYIPRYKQPDPDAKEDADEKLTEEQQKAKEESDKAKQEQSDQEMTKLAESMRARAAAGEDFLKLQKEAFTIAGLKIDSPTVNLPKVRRTGLPPGHSVAFELKSGEVSQVVSDSGGHYIYKINSSSRLALTEVRDEIHNTLQTQRSKDAMEKYTTSFKVETNEAYFGAAGAAGAHAMPPHLPNPRLAPSATAPAAPPQAQPPAPKPN